MADFEIAIKKLLAKEGGYVNDPSDPGGETKFGISKRAYPNLDIKNLSIDEAKAIYRRDYWQPLGLDTEPSQHYAEQLFFSGVHMGLSACRKLLGQMMIGLSREQIKLLQFKLLMIDRYRAICNRRQASRKYLLGWLNRILA